MDHAGAYGKNYSIAISSPKDAPPSHLKVEPLAMSGCVEVRAEVKLVVRVCYPDGSTEVTRLEPEKNNDSDDNDKVFKSPAAPTNC